VSNASNTLYGVNASSASDAWAVGNECSEPACPDPGITTDTITLHWNGKKWSRATATDPGSSVNDLQAVSAVSASDIWAAGLQLGASLPCETLTEHWNGKGWSAVASPNGTTSSVGLNVNFLSGVGAISRTDAVAVGWVQIGTAYQVLILNWNGTKWSIA
jgi:hypothetical protein